jgi:hypothetical protein
MRHVVIGLVALSCFGVRAQGVDQCKPRGVDVCALASKVAMEMAPSLPMQVSANMSIASVTGFKNLVTLTALFAYDRAYLHQVMSSSKIPLSKIHEVMRNSAKSTLCVPGSLASTFVNAGGIVVYYYKFADGTFFYHYKVAEC